METNAKDCGQETKDFIPGNCLVLYCINIIGGKWKSSIVHMIRTGRNRDSILIKNITEITKLTFTNQLKAVETNRLIERVIFSEIPPGVEYTLTNYGKTLLSIIDSMYRWGRQHMKTENKGYSDK